MITVLTGGTGGAKFVWGLAQVLAPEELTVVVNTGDDLAWWGLHVSPDIDSVIYALSGLLSKDRGWGFESDTFRCLQQMKSLGAESWFQLGDSDLAMHIRRTHMLNEGYSLTEVTANLARALGVSCRVLPMSDDPLMTRITTAGGELSFQEYFVRERWQVPATGVSFIGAKSARSAPGVMEAIVGAEAVIVAPSNPVTSIGPILSVPGIRDALRCTTAPVAAVSPIIGETAVSGPAAHLMKMQGFEPSARGITTMYSDFLDLLIADVTDESRRADLESTGVAIRFEQTVMNASEDKQTLARQVVDAVRQTPKKAAVAGKNAR